MKTEEINRRIATWMLDYEDLKTGKCFKRSRDYFNDLNAIAEAEGKLVEKIETCLAYQENLIKACDSEQYPHAHSFIWHATAPQRCEALLRTIGRWED